MKKIKIKLWKKYSLFTDKEFKELLQEWKEVLTFNK